MKRGLPVMLTAQQVADWLEVDRKQVYAMVEQGQIPRKAWVKIGARLRFFEEALILWLTEKRASSGQERGQ